ncbi:MAG TPA: nucleotidyltransferase family protein [Alphaproteobacteria bacterium]|nr:nucleotidyltransferase family protein [Alphaproteobacteria bacterium]
MTHEHPALVRLRQIRPTLRNPNIRRMRVFGSVATDSCSKDSDIDILLDFASPPSLFDLSELQNDLQEHLGMRVDLALADGLFPEIRDRILSEAVDV